MTCRKPIVIFLSVALTCAAAVCPMMGTPPDGHPPVPRVTPQQSSSQILEYLDALTEIDFDAVVAKIRTALTTEDPNWPSDHGNYGPFMIRLAWHCAGSYRNSDGRGGCDGGRIRHTPESNWPDNGNLDKALDILRPIKAEFGMGLSWGDLIVLAGNTAIESMGGPLLGFCGGRLDDSTGADSLVLGPSPEQQEQFPCRNKTGGNDAGNSQCQAPLGASVVGLIYVNPAGPVFPNGTRNVDPAASAQEIREVFGRMGFDDEMTVAAIGGGHAFGKCHGDPDGVTTSGFEGAWTLAPTVWTNLYFTELFAREDDWEVWDGPNGDAMTPQWRIGLDVEDRSEVMMLTTDMAMIKDPVYREISARFAADITQLETAFGKAWYALMTRDMGPWKRCVGAAAGSTKVPPPQDWQLDLPDPAADLPDFDAVKEAIKDEMPDESTRDAFVYLAFRCMATFRYTDHLGGCNGALIRFAPQSEWEVNTGLDVTLAKLAPVFNTYTARGLTWADLIVLAGIVGVEAGGSDPIDFCGGMTDAVSGDTGVQFVSEALARSGPNEVLAWRQELMGLTAEEVVALQGMPRGEAEMLRIGRRGTWSETAKGVSNHYFSVLLGETWEATASGAGASGSGPQEYKAAGKDVFITEFDKAILDSEEYSAIAARFAEDEQAFKTVFQSAWTKLTKAGLLRRLVPPPPETAAAPTTTPLPVDESTAPRLSSPVKSSFAALAVLLMAVLVRN